MKEQQREILTVDSGSVLCHPRLHQSRRATLLTNTSRAAIFGIGDHRRGAGRPRQRLVTWHSWPEQQFIRTLHRPNPTNWLELSLTCIKVEAPFYPCSPAAVMTPKTLWVRMGGRLRPAIAFLLALSGHCSCATPYLGHITPQHRRWAEHNSARQEPTYTELSEFLDWLLCALKLCPCG